MSFSQLARLRRVLVRCRRPGLEGWGSRAFLPLRSASCPCLGFTLLLLIAVPAPADPPTFEVNTARSTDGHFVLAWDHPLLPDGTLPQFVLEESAGDQFGQARRIYQGPDKSRVMSGKPDGLYYYRLGLTNPDHPQSTAAVQVQVQHHSLSRALLFFGLGLVVFVTTLVTVLRGGGRMVSDS